MKYILSILLIISALINMLTACTDKNAASGAELEILYYDGPVSGAQMELSDEIHTFEVYVTHKDGLLEGSKVMSSSVYLMDALVANDIITTTHVEDRKEVFRVKGETCENGWKIIIDGEEFVGDFTKVLCKDTKKIEFRYK